MPRLLGRSRNYVSIKMFKKKITILMVCTANICRSPMAQGVMQKIIQERGLKRRIKVDSAGTHVSRAGTRPDIRARQVASGRGVDISRFKSRMLEASDYERYDYIVAMDRENMHRLVQECPPENKHKLSSIMDYSAVADVPEVPDPYFGNLTGFERVIELLEPACVGLVNSILERHQVT